MEAVERAVLVFYAPVRAVTDRISWCSRADRPPFAQASSQRERREAHAAVSGFSASEVGQTAHAGSWGIRESDSDATGGMGGIYGAASVRACAGPVYGS